MTPRPATVDALVRFSRPLAEIKADLQTHPWDCDTELVILTREHIATILERYLNGLISEGETEEWANLIEGRDDIGFEKAGNDIVAACIDELANPYLRGKLDKNRAMQLQELLRGSDEI